MASPIGESVVPPAIVERVARWQLEGVSSQIRVEGLYVSNDSTQGWNLTKEQIERANISSVGCSEAPSVCVYLQPPFSQRIGSKRVNTDLLSVVYSVSVRFGDYAIDCSNDLSGPLNTGRTVRAELANLAFVAATLHGVSVRSVGVICAGDLFVGTQPADIRGPFLPRYGGNSVRLDVLPTRRPMTVESSDVTFRDAHLGLVFRSVARDVFGPDAKLQFLIEESDTVEVDVQDIRSVVVDSGNHWELLRITIVLTASPGVKLLVKVSGRQAIGVSRTAPSREQYSRDLDTYHTEEVEKFSRVFANQIRRRLIESLLK